MAIKTKSSDSRRTPNWILDMYKDWFDPCPYNLSPEIDGLEIDWQDKTYVNPPYGNNQIIRWVHKAIKECRKGKRIVMLLPADTSTRYYADLVSAGAGIWMSCRRVKFIGYKAPAWGSMLVFLHPEEIKNDALGRISE